MAALDIRNHTEYLQDAFWSKLKWYRIYTLYFYKYYKGIQTAQQVKTFV